MPSRAPSIPARRNRRSPGNPESKESITVAKFAPTFLELSAVDNKPSTVDEKELTLRRHLVPYFGEMPLGKVSFAAIQDYKAAKVKDDYNEKTINNHLMILRRMLEVARKRGLIETVPEIEWLKAPKPAFDFLTFEEAERLLAAADGEWRVMFLVALRTGLRQSELLGLRWEDVDLKAGRLVVRQAIVRGRIGTPKSGKPREVPLSSETVRALKEHRHLRGQYVFSYDDGEPLQKTCLRRPLPAACKKAGLRNVGWHVLRHTFASHLTMRGVPLKVIQELLGHSTMEMTMRYAHLAPEVRRDAVELLDRRGSVVAAGPQTASNCS